MYFECTLSKVVYLSGMFTVHIVKAYLHGILVVHCLKLFAWVACWKYMFLSALSEQ